MASNQELKRNASTGKIDSYFIKMPRAENKQMEKEIITEVSSRDIVASTSQNNQPASTNQNSTSQSIHSASTIQNSQSDFPADIGFYIKTNNISDSIKANLIENHWVPPPNYNFPFCIVSKNGKETKKYAKKSHLEKFQWLVLSHKDQGLYCRFCALFAFGSGGGVQTNTPLKCLVKEPLKAFDNLLGEKGALMMHQKNKYHEKALEAAENFLKIYHGQESDISKQISQQRMQQKKVKENRDRLRPIVQTIILCGRQNIPLQGHRDDGNVYDQSKTTSEKDQQRLFEQEGNFKALLKFRIEAGDVALSKHLETTNATVQNELISICKEVIQATITNKIREAQIFSIIFDETTDVSHTEQLSLSFRYFHNGQIREDFLTFCNAYEKIPCEDGTSERRLTGIALAKIVEILCFDFNIDLAGCVGIGTDSCSASETKSAVHELCKIAIHAKRCPCSNHALNNSLVRSSKVPSCRNASATMKKVVDFANASAKRHLVFVEELGGAALKGICETRWVERHDGHLQFQGPNLVKICNALERISLWEESKTACEAKCLQQCLKSSEFLIATVCLCDVLGVTVSLSRFLQKSSLDLKKATDAITDVMSVLADKRNDVENCFGKLFSEAEKIAEEMDVVIRQPRTVSEQIHRQNFETSQSAEAYFRRTIYIPLLDFLLADLKERLSKDVLELFHLGVFLPRISFSEEELNSVCAATKTYSHILKNPPISMVCQEYKLWMKKWQRAAEKSEALPESIAEMIDACDKELYPNIFVFLQIFASLPVSVATEERSFSTLRRLKTWLRSNMGEERLTGLALMNIHKDITLDADDIITKFSRKKNEKLISCFEETNL